LEGAVIIPGCSACLRLRRSQRMIRRSWVIRAVPAAAISWRYFLRGSG
jgi:hypothetical protein